MLQLIPFPPSWSLALVSMVSVVSVVSAALLELPLALREDSEVRREGEVGLDSVLLDISRMGSDVGGLLTVLYLTFLPLRLREALAVVGVVRGVAFLSSRADFSGSDTVSAWLDAWE